MTREMLRVTFIAGDLITLSLDNGYFIKANHNTEAVAGSHCNIQL